MTVQLYSVNDLSKIIKLHPITIHKKIKTAPETLPKHIRIGKRVFFTQEAVEAFLRGEKGETV